MGGWGGGDSDLWSVIKQLQGKGKGKGKNPLKKFSAEQKVWVGGVPAEAKWKEVKELFDSVAKTKWIECFSKSQTACICYGSAEEATTAIATLNGSVLGSSVITCDLWTKKE